MRHPHVYGPQGINDTSDFYGLSVKTGKSKHLHSPRGVQQVRESRHALEHRQGFDRAPVARAKGVFWACALSVGARRYDLQDSFHDRVSRSARSGLEARAGGEEK